MPPVNPEVGISFVLRGVNECITEMDRLHSHAQELLQGSYDPYNRQAPTGGAPSWKWGPPSEMGALPPSPSFAALPAYAPATAPAYQPPGQSSSLTVGSVQQLVIQRVEVVNLTASQVNAPALGAGDHGGGGGGGELMAALAAFMAGRGVLPYLGMMPGGGGIVPSASQHSWGGATKIHEENGPALPPHGPAQPMPGSSGWGLVPFGGLMHSGGGGGGMPPDPGQRALPPWDPGPNGPGFAVEDAGGGRGGPGSFATPGSRRLMLGLLGATLPFAAEGLNQYATQQHRSMTYEEQYAGYINAVPSLLDDIPVIGKLARPLFAPKLEKVREMDAIRDFSATSVFEAGGGGTERRALRDFLEGTGTVGGVGNNGRLSYLQAGEAREYVGTIGGAVPGMFSDMKGLHEAVGTVESLVNKDMRPAERKAIIDAAAQAMRFAQSDPDLALQMVGDHRTPLNSYGMNTMGALAALSGNVGEAQNLLALNARLPDKMKGDLAGLPTESVLMQRMGLLSQVAGQETTLAGIGVARAGATMQGATGIGAALNNEQARLAVELDARKSELAEAEKLAALSPDDPAVQSLLNQRRVATAQTESQLAANPFQQIQNTYQGAMTRSGAAGTVAASQLGLVAQLGLGSGAAMDAGFGAQQRSVALRVSAAQRRYDSLQAQPGVGTEILEAAQAELQAAQAAASGLGMQQRDFRFAQDSRSGAAQASSGQAAFGAAVAGNFADTPEAKQAFGVIQTGLRSQLAAAARRLQEVLADPTAGDAAKQEAQAVVSGLQAAIRQGAVSYSQQITAGLMFQAGQGQAIGGAELSVFNAYGRLEGRTGAEGKENTSIARQRDTARAEAQRARNEGRLADAMELDRQAAQYDAMAQTNPLSQMQARQAIETQSVQLSLQSLGAGLQTQVLQGAGGAGTVETQRAQVSAAQQALQTAVNQRAEMLRNGARPDDLMVQRQDAMISQATLGVEQARTGLGNVPIPLGLQEQLAQGRYTAQVLATVPGSYGNLRGALMGQMGTLEQEAHVIQERLRTDGPNMSEQGRYDARNRLRSIGLEEAGLTQQLSFGWQERLISQAIGTRGDFNMDARGFSWRDAVHHGVASPHFGASRGQLPGYLAWSTNFRMPSTAPGYHGPVTGHGESVPGMPALPSFGAPGGPPPTGTGNRGMSGDPAKIDITIRFEGAGGKTVPIKTSQTAGSNTSVLASLEDFLNAAGMRGSAQ